MAMAGAGIRAHSCKRSGSGSGGGSSGWQSPGADEFAFVRAEKLVADHLRTSPAVRKNGSRVAHDIDHR